MHVGVQSPGDEEHLAERAAHCARDRARGEPRGAQRIRVVGPGAGDGLHHQQPPRGERVHHGGHGHVGNRTARPRRGALEVGLAASGVAGLDAEVELLAEARSHRARHPRERRALGVAPLAAVHELGGHVTEEHHQRKVGTHLGADARVLHLDCDLAAAERGRERGEVHLREAGGSDGRLIYVREDGVHRRVAMRAKLGAEYALGVAPRARGS
mmetsp:Transcript_772/g.3001  ORF Transcript_772/g.3001 Transcript_772/m.3001 type:complete len:213 (+) Transcript_772:803-1441(+)